ncbi:MAG: hypothetical protein OJF62_003521 [Pseudolabrys sp.]|jgi:hypothetical protein|nr:hypothetical protein [Pseudolabrys sp.]
MEILVWASRQPVFPVDPAAAPDLRADYSGRGSNCNAA